MRDANAQLEEEHANGIPTKGSFEIMDDQERPAEHDDEPKQQYIELNLGLGVLEEKGLRAVDTSSSSSSSSEDEEDRSMACASVVRGKISKEEDVLGKLMGQKRHHMSRIRAVEDG